MDPERWKRVDNLLQAALERPLGERVEFLQRACLDDKALEREVLSLLASRQQAEGFLETPAIEVAARALALQPDLGATEIIVNVYEYQPVFADEVLIARDGVIAKCHAVHRACDASIVNALDLSRCEEKRRTRLERT
jgi:hypothetical protein